MKKNKRLRRKSLKSLHRGIEMLKKDMHDPTSSAHRVLTDLFSCNHEREVGERVAFSDSLTTIHTECDNDWVKIRKGTIIAVTPTTEFSDLPEMKGSIIKRVLIKWDCGCESDYSSESIHFHKIVEG